MISTLVLLLCAIFLKPPMAYCSWNPKVYCNAVVGRWNVLSMGDCMVVWEGLINYEVAIISLSIILFTFKSVWI